MFDLGVYNVTTLTGLLGPARRVMAMSGIAIPERVVDGELIQVGTHDNAHLLLDFGDARYAVVTTGFTMQRYKVPGIELYGTEGTIQMIGEDWAPAGYEMWQNSAGCWQVFEDGSQLALERRHPPHDRMHRNRDPAGDHSGARLSRAGDHAQVDGVGATPVRQSPSRAPSPRRASMAPRHSAPAHTSSTTRAPRT